MFSIVIPSRLESSRFPNKILALVKNKPLLQHLIDKLDGLNLKAEHILLCNNNKIAEKINLKKFRLIVTNKICLNGTERIAKHLNNIKNDLILNIQADEGLSHFNFLEKFINHWQQHTNDIHTPIYKINSYESLDNPNTVKVVKTRNNKAIYFSRHPLPFVRDYDKKNWLTQQNYWGHMGVYAYSKKHLALYLKQSISEMEKSEKLEQLRFIEMQEHIQTYEINNTFVRSVDSPEDIKNDQSS